MANGTFPFNVVGKKAYEDEFRIMFEHLGDGVLNDTTGGGNRLTATGTNRTVTLQPGDFKVAGFVRHWEDPVPFDASLLGAQPGVGQSRINVAVMRLDLPNKTITPTLLTGAPATSGPVRPVLTNTATVRDAPFWSYVDTPNATTAGALALGDERGWLGPDYYLAATAPLPDDAPIGSRAEYPDGRVYRRRLAGWEKLDARQRIWVFDRVSSRDVNGVAGSQELVAGSIPNAPAGDYLVTGTLILQGTGTASMRLTAAGHAVIPDIRTDPTPDPMPHTASGAYVHTSGTPVFTLSLLGSSGASVRTRGSRITVAYLGPRS